MINKNQTWNLIKDYQIHSNSYIKEIEYYEILILTSLEHLYPDISKNILINWAVDIAWNNADLEDCKKILDSKIGIKD